MALTQIYTAVPNDVITAARWNNEFGNLYNNPGTYVASASFVSTGTSASRTVADRAADYLNVKDYGTVGNGVSSDQSAVASAVAAAVASGQELYWPKGTYLTTASLTSFHSIRHTGPGILKRGSTLFYVDPTYWSGTAKTNNLYVATTGNDTNDGLSVAEPRLTVLSMGNVIYNYPYADITWKVNIAAGTYNTTGSTFSKQFPTPNRVQFLGPSVGAGVQPTVIVQAATPTTNTTGFYFQGFALAQVSDINFKSFRAGASPSSSLLGSGLLGDGRCDIYTTNVWTDDCDQGMYFSNGTQVRVQAGRHGYNAVNGNGIQLIRHSHGSIGYNGSAADVNGVTGTAFIGGQRGVILQEFAMAHTDYCYFSAQTFSGVLITTGRVHSVLSTYDSCNVGIDARLNANLGETSNTYTSCTQNKALRSGSRLTTDVVDESTDFGPPTKQYSTVAVTTQSATPVTAYTKTFDAKEFETRGSGFVLRIYGNVTGVANTKTVTVTLGATTLLTATIAAATTHYELVVRMVVVTQATTQYYFTSKQENGVLQVNSLSTTGAEDLSASKTLTVTHQVTNVADLNRLAMIELETQH